VTAGRDDVPAEHLVRAGQCPSYMEVGPVSSSLGAPRQDDRSCCCDWPTLCLTNTFAMLGLLPMSNRDKDLEILALRRQLDVLQRQLGGTRARFSPADRALVTALLHRATAPDLAQAPSADPPGHRPTLAPRTASPTPRAPASQPKHPGRPRTIRSIRLLALRLAKENPS
jgi:putative transposase